MSAFLKVITIVPLLIDVGEKIAGAVRRRRARKAAEKLHEASELAREIQAKVDAERARRRQK